CSQVSLQFQTYLLPFRLVLLSFFRLQLLVDIQSVHLSTYETFVFAARFIHHPFFVYSSPSLNIFGISDSAFHLSSLNLAASKTNLPLSITCLDISDTAFALFISSFNSSPFKSSAFNL